MSAKTRKAPRLLHSHSELLRDLDNADALGFEPTIAEINSRRGESLVDTIQVFEDLLQMGRIEPAATPVSLSTPWRKT